MPQISVIVPVFNAERYLTKSLFSIADQSFSDIEIICVNDKSIDRSAEIVSDLARNDRRIRLFNHATNLGPGGARNTGIAQARSDYLLFVDSDDFIDPNMLEVLFESTEGGRYDVVESGCRAIGDDDGELIWEYTPQPAAVDDLDGHPDRMFLLREWGLPQKLWRKSLFAGEGVSFPTHVYWEDVSLIPILLLKAKRLKKLDSVFYNYIQRKNSISNSVSVKHIVDLFGAFEYIKAFLINNGIYGRERNNFKRIVTHNTKYLSIKMQSVEGPGGEHVNRFVERCANLANAYLRHEDKPVRISDQDVLDIVLQPREARTASN